MMKICCTCGLEKELSAAFSKKSAAKDGHQSYCKECRSEYDRLKSTPEKKAKKKADRIIRIARNPERAKVYEKHRRQITREWRRQYHLNRLHNDLSYRLAHNLRSRLKSALKRGYKAGSAVRDLGCSIPEFRAHLESQFLPGMSWGNYGTVWNLDHRVPLAAFNLHDHEQMLRAAHFSNLQPMWSSVNSSKGSKYQQEVYHHYQLSQTRSPPQGNLPSSE
jgi:hypothetical protein